MGFMSGVVTGVALAAGAAAWYMSRSGERFRDQYRVDRKLGEIGDQLELRTREIQSTVNAQLAEMRTKGSEATAGKAVGEAAATLDDAQASAAEAAAELAADVEARAAKVKKSAKTAASE
jgi:gas vesicle protein